MLHLCIQVVAVAVFLALGFAFYVFFAPFVGRKVSQYVVMGVYTPLVCSSPFRFLVHFHMYTALVEWTEFRSVFFCCLLASDSYL